MYILLSDHPYFVAVQYHPEYISRPMKPAPPYFGLLLASCGKLQSYLSRGCRLSPRSRISESDTSGDEEELVAELARLNSKTNASDSS